MHEQTVTNPDAPRNTRTFHTAPGVSVTVAITSGRVLVEDAAGVMGYTSVAEALSCETHPEIVAWLREHVEGLWSRRHRDLLALRCEIERVEVEIRRHCADIGGPIEGDLDAAAAVATRVAYASIMDAQRHLSIALHAVGVATNVARQQADAERGAQ